MLRLLACTIVFSTAFIRPSSAQQIQPYGYFVEDSIKIGQPTPYSLSITYPKHMEVLMPDSLFDYSPYELTKKEFFPSVLKDSVILDSVVYYLSSFEIDKIQKLKLPVFILQEKDSVPVYSAEDSIVLVEYIPVVTDSLKLKVNTGYQKVPVLFNYPYLIIGAVVLMVIILVVIIVFGKSIRKKYKLYRLKKKHIKFIEQFNRKIRKVKDQPESEHVERTLIFWKAYMEQLERKPYQKWTTKELNSHIDDNKLLDAMKKVDAFIYGGISSEGIHRSFEDLEYFTNERYQQKISEIANG